MSVTKQSQHSGAIHTGRGQRTHRQNGNSSSEGRRTSWSWPGRAACQARGWEKSEPWPSDPTLALQEQSDSAEGGARRTQGDDLEAKGKI